jgi:hypothetical protein
MTQEPIIVFWRLAGSDLWQLPAAVDGAAVRRADEYRIGLDGHEVVTLTLATRRSANYRFGSFASFFLCSAARPVYPRKLTTCCNAQVVSLGPTTDPRAAKEALCPWPYRDSHLISFFVSTCWLAGGRRPISRPRAHIR